MRVARSLAVGVAVVGGLSLLIPHAVRAASPATPSVSCQPTTQTVVDPASLSVPRTTTVTFNIRVDETWPNGCSGFGAPNNGSVVVSDNGTVVATLPDASTQLMPDYTNHAMSGSWKYTFNNIGAHAMLFTYSNTANNPTGSSFTSNINVHGAPVLATPTSSSNPAMLGTQVAFTGWVDWSRGAATSNQMLFWDGSTVIGKGSINYPFGTTGGGTATLTTSNLSLGVHRITTTVPDPAGGAGVIRSGILVQTISPDTTPPTTPTPSPPIATPTAAPAATATPAGTSAPAQPTQTVVVVPAGSSTTPPPGAAPAGMAGQFHLTGSNVPLVGAQAPQEMTAGMYDSARVPPVSALTAIPVSFGDALSIWPALVLAIAGCAYGIYRVRRNWLLEEEAEATEAFLTDVGGLSPHPQGWIQ